MRNARGYGGHRRASSGGSRCPAWRSSWTVGARPGSSGQVAAGRRQLGVQVARGVIADRPVRRLICAGGHPALGEVGGVELARGARGRRSRLLLGGHCGAVPGGGPGCGTLQDRVGAHSRAVSGSTRVAARRRSRGRSPGWAPPPGPSAASPWPSQPGPGRTAARTADHPGEPAHGQHDAAQDDPGESSRCPGRACGSPPPSGRCTPRTPPGASRTPPPTGPRPRPRQVVHPADRPANTTTSRRPPSPSARAGHAQRQQRADDHRPRPRSAPRSARADPGA
jgi:hypothetical protein